jgi:alkylation response protein AidB-like acyl-CoA dehydrogenase
VSLGGRSTISAPTRKRKCLVRSPRAGAGRVRADEPNAGSGRGRHQTTACAENHGWRVNGTKSYITNGWWPLS